MTKTQSTPSPFFDIVGTQVKHKRSEAIDPPTTSAPDISGCSGPATSWAEQNGSFWCTAHSYNKLPVGFYKLAVAPNVGAVFMSQKNDTDNLIEFADSASSLLMDEIRQFKGLRASFREHGFLYKRGILIWGPAGSGKTATLQLLVKMLMLEHDSIAVLIESPRDASICLQTLRRIEPERQVVAIMEDLDALIERFGESEYLSLLDGEAQVDNICYIATTNYPERLDRRFVDRPSRFDTIRYIGMPSPNARATYLKAKISDIGQQDLDLYVKASESYSVAHMRELIILTQCFGVSLHDAKGRLDLMKQQPSSERAPDRPPLGFYGFTRVPN